MSAPADRTLSDPPPAGTILIIDDEPGVRNVARALLERAGYRVLPAETGAQGVALFAEHASAIRLVILDLSMPQLSATQVVQELARLRSDVRVLLTSGYSAKESAAPEGPNIAGFLHKPFRFNELLEAVRSVVG